MKYDVVTRAISEWAYTVEASSPEEAELFVQAAIDEDEQMELPGRVYDQGTEEVLQGHSPRNKERPASS